MRCLCSCAPSALAAETTARWELELGWEPRKIRRDGGWHWGYKLRIVGRDDSHKKVYIWKGVVWSLQRGHWIRRRLLRRQRRA